MLDLAFACGYSPATMGALGGALTYTKFHVRGEVPRGFQSKFVRSIRLRAFRPLDPQEDVESRSGWCAVDDATALDMRQENIIWNAYLLLGFRTDRWRLPPALFKAQYQTVLREMKELTGQDRLSKKQKNEAKLRVTRRLRKRVIPSMRKIDLVWNLDAESLLFWSASKSATEELTALFEKTFQLKLDQDCPYFAAAKSGSIDPARLIELRPLPIGTPSAKIGLPGRAPQQRH